MFNIDYKQSKHMKEVRKDHLEKIKEEPKDNEKTYIYGYLKDQTDAMILNGIGWALCRIIEKAMDNSKKEKTEPYKGSFFLHFCGQFLVRKSGQWSEISVQAMVFIFLYREKVVKWSEKVGKWSVFGQF